MTSSPRPWYWAWRDWGLSIWALLFWTALLWPAIVSTLRSDELFAGEMGGVLIVVWLGGTIAIALAERSADRYRRARPTAPEPQPSRVREALPFVAAALLAALVIGTVVSALPSRPDALETAVAEQWRGESYTVSLFAVGGGDPATANATDVADSVSCSEIDGIVSGEPVHVCEIVHCDVGQASFLDCPATTSPACAALVDGRLVLVSRSWSTGSQALRDELARAAGRRCPV